MPREEDSFPLGERAAREGFMEEEVLGLTLKDGYLTAVCAGVCKRDREKERERVSWGPASGTASPGPPGSRAGWVSKI